MKPLLRVILGFNAAALIHLLRFRPRLFLAACVNAFFASKNAVLSSGPAIPSIALGEILGDRKAQIRLSVIKHDDGMLPPDQALALLSILVAEAPREILEIGTFMGHTTLQMAENVPTAVVHTVDLPESFSAGGDPQQNIPKDDFHLIARRVVGRDFIGQPSASRIKQHYTDTAAWDFRNAGSPTFFFIDGSHTYEYCKNDSEKCFELSRTGSVFLWHDCDEPHPGVIRLLSEWRAMGRDIRRISGTPLAYWKRP